jgi:hypothetical protein
VSIISLTDYFRDYEKPDYHVANARILLERVNNLLSFAETEGLTLKINPKTHSHISGTYWGGYRTPECDIGAPKSAHKQAQAVDIFDPDGTLDRWLNDLILTKFDLYREHPDHTNGWCHVGTKAPRSGKRTFLP